MVDKRRFILVENQVDGLDSYMISFKSLLVNYLKRDNNASLVKAQLLVVFPPEKEENSNDFNRNFSRNPFMKLNLKVSFKLFMDR